MANQDSIRNRLTHVRYILQGYDERWDEKTEKKFCCILRHYVITAPMTDEVDFEISLPDIARDLNDEMETNYTLGQVRKQFYVLKDRYNTFKYLLEQENVHYDPVTNLINVPAVVQTTAMERWPLATIYFYTGEAYWNLLTGVFSEMERVDGIIGEYELKAEVDELLKRRQRREVITISDSQDSAASKNQKASFHTSDFIDLSENRQPSSAVKSSQASNIPTAVRLRRFNCEGLHNVPVGDAGEGTGIYEDGYSRYVDTDSYGEWVRKMEYNQPASTSNSVKSTAASKPGDKLI